MKRENFSLKKVRLQDEGGLEMDFTCSEKEPDGNHDVIYSVSHDGVRHPDLDAHAKNLREYLAMNYHIDKDEHLDKITCTGISVSGNEGLRGAIISGKIVGLNGKSAMNTSRICFASDEIGIEKDVEQIFNAIEDECYEYVFNRKRAQLELEFTITEPEEKELSGKEKRKARATRGKKKEVEEVE